MQLPTQNKPLSQSSQALKKTNKKTPHFCNSELPEVDPMTNSGHPAGYARGSPPNEAVCVALGLSAHRELTTEAGCSGHSFPSPPPPSPQPSAGPGRPQLSQTPDTPAHIAHRKTKELEDNMESSIHFKNCLMEHKLL